MTVQSHGGGERAGLAGPRLVGERLVLPIIFCSSFLAKLQRLFISELSVELSPNSRRDLKPDMKMVVMVRPLLHTGHSRIVEENHLHRQHFIGANQIDEFLCQRLRIVDLSR